MQLTYDRDYLYNGNYAQVKPGELIGPALIVWNSLVRSGLNPALEYWPPHVYKQGGYNIVIYW